MECNAELTELIFVIDRSGSMSGLEDSTIKGYNDFLREQASLPGRLKVSTVLFDTEYQLLYDGAAPENALLSSALYRPQGCTALYDAMGRSIVDVSSRIACAAPQDRPGKVIVVLTTDGYENSSTDFGQAEVKRLIQRMERENDWKFLFFGANIDSAAAAQEIGIDRQRARNFKASPKGMAECMRMACACVAEERQG